MVELTIGSRFYYGDKLCEVVKGTCINSICVFDTNDRKCEKAKCNALLRHDGEWVHFEEVKNDKN